MELTHWQFMGALGGVIGIGWLVIVPMYRNWTHLNETMTHHIKRSIRMTAECDEARSTTAWVTLPMPMDMPRDRSKS